MARNSTINEAPFIKPNKNCHPEQEINILLIGQTGVGKSTFINSLANYMCNDTLQDAVNDPMQTVIPSSFVFTDQETFEQKTIKIDESEALGEPSQSCTQQCRSFVFPIGNKNLRIIDTPGIGDTRGVEQDRKHFHEILTYISHFEHLNAICILLKANEEPVLQVFRYRITEILRHFHVSACENISFVFTNVRRAFFIPGTATQILRTLLKQYKEDYRVTVPFSEENAFLLDNNSFRYLALCRNGIQFNNKQRLIYQKSWDHTVKEYSRLVDYIVKCPLHAVRNTISLNEAEQLIRKLPRPIAETAKLIEENIQLAKWYKQNVLLNPQAAVQGIPQNEATIVTLKHPQLVCVGENCRRIISDNNIQKFEYLSRCHEECYLKGVVQETINDRRILECEVIDCNTGKCLKCGCSWKQHQHITYEWKTNVTRLNAISSLSTIDKRVTDLQNEKATIDAAYKQLSKFLHENAILPLNDDIIEYLKHFIHDEQIKKYTGTANNDVIQGLERMMKDFEEEMKLFKKTIKHETDPSHARGVLQPEETFLLVGTLFRLPLIGKTIRGQLEGMKLSQEAAHKKQEIYIRLPIKANSSTLMMKFKASLDSR